MNKPNCIHYLVVRNAGVHETYHCVYCNYTVSQKDITSRIEHLEKYAHALAKWRMSRGTTPSYVAAYEAYKKLRGDVLSQIHAIS